MSSDETRVFDRLQLHSHRLRGENVDTFGIIPQAHLWTPWGWRFPDFVLTYGGGVAAIEVDGESHRGRFDHDRSRDNILEDSGVWRVRHIDVRDTENTSELDRHIERTLFLARERR